MKKEFLLFCLGGFFLLAKVTAMPARPLVTVSIGEDAPNTSLNQSITLISPYQNSYSSGTATMQPVGGLFLGGETPVFTDLLAQLGIGYYQNSPFTINGTVYQFANPAMDNLTYQYYVVSKRLVVEGKLVANSANQIHPFIMLGVGEAFNQAYRYLETPVASNILPMSQGFNNRTYHAMTYEIGFGLDISLDDHVRLGAVYRFVNLGKVGLGTTPLQDTTQAMTYNQLRMNEFLLQLSYVG